MKAYQRESQELVLNLLKAIGHASAYDLMDENERNNPEDNKNKAFAIRQRISGACSELHRDNKVHVVGQTANPTSGELVSVYALNNNPKNPCPCGDCPNGGKGYKGKYELLLEKTKEETAELVEQNETLIMMNERLREDINALRIKLFDLENKLDLAKSEIHTLEFSR
jgi:hypothetical protein